MRKYIPVSYLDTKQLCGTHNEVYRIFFYVGLLREQQAVVAKEDLLKSQLFVGAEEQDLVAAEWEKFNNTPVRRIDLNVVR